MVEYYIAIKKLAIDRHKSMFDSQRLDSKERKAVLEDADSLIPFLELSRKDKGMLKLG